MGSRLFLVEISREAESEVSVTLVPTGQVARERCSPEGVAATTDRLQRELIESVLGPAEGLRFHVGRSDRGDVVAAEHATSGIRTGWLPRGRDAADRERLLAELIRLVAASA